MIGADNAGKTRRALLSGLGCQREHSGLYWVSSEESGGFGGEEGGQGPPGPTCLSAPNPRTRLHSLRARSGAIAAALVRASLSGCRLCLISGQGIAHSCPFSGLFLLWFILSLGFAGLASAVVSIPRGRLRPSQGVGRTEGSCCAGSPRG